MSKTQQAKDKQNYNPKPILPICSNCIFFQFDKIPSSWNPSFIQEKNLRCGIGGFAVKKMASCSEYKLPNQ